MKYAVSCFLRLGMFIVGCVSIRHDVSKGTHPLLKLAVPLPESSRDGHWPPTLNGSNICDWCKNLCDYCFDDNFVPGSVSNDPNLSRLEISNHLPDDVTFYSHGVPKPISTNAMVSTHSWRICLTYLSSALTIVCQNYGVCWSEKDGKIIVHK